MNLAIEHKGGGYLVIRDSGTFCQVGGGGGGLVGGGG